MNRTKIEWTRGPRGEPGYTWNPIKGLCPEACWYCYARAIYRRFKLDPEPWLDIAELNMTLKSRVTGKRVFVCSTFELFSPKADTIHERGWSWRDYIFDVIGRRPDLTFIILTKRPERIDRPMPPNVWLGVSMTGTDDLWRLAHLVDAQAKMKFASMEPLLGRPIGYPLNLDWLIIGRLTGHGHKHDPSPRELQAAVKVAQDEGVPIFLKNNLKDIWPGPLIQEFPR